VGASNYMSDDLVNLAADDIRAVMNTATELMNYCSWLVDELWVGIGMGAPARGVLSVKLLRDIVTDLEIGDYGLHGAVVGLLEIAESV